MCRKPSKWKMDMRHRSDTPQELGGTGHLGVRGIWGCWESGGVGHLGVQGVWWGSGTGQGAQDLHTCLMQKQSDDVSATRRS